MKKKLFGILLFIIFLLIATKVEASSASISISPTNPKVGDNVVITVSATNVNTATIYAEVSGIISDTIKLVDGSISGEPRNFSTSKTYKCNSEGVINVKTTSGSRAILKGTDVDVSASASAKVVSNSSSNSGNSNTSTTSTKSNNANLSNLGIRPKEYDFSGFRYGNTTYNVTVPYEVETVEVYANVQDSKAKLTGTGNKKLKEGTNVAQVVVTAEDGTKKTYTINIVRNSETNEVVPNAPDDREEEKIEKLRLTAIALQNDLNLKLSPIFDSEIFEYTVEVEEELEKLEVSGIPNINSAIVQIEGNDNLSEENNLITLTVSASGYEDAVYKIKVLKKIPTKVEEKKEILEASKDELDNSNVMSRNIVICAVAVLLIIVIILVIILKVRKRGKGLDNSYNEDEYYIRNNIENSNYENNEIEEDYETPQGYTAEIETDEEYETERKRRKGRGKHF